MIDEGSDGDHLERIFYAILPLIRVDFWQFRLKNVEIYSSQVCADLVPEQKEQKEPFEESLDHSSQNGWKLKEHSAPPSSLLRGGTRRY